MARSVSGWLLLLQLLLLCGEWAAAMVSGGGR
jgi:hypothetical protein